MKIHDFNIQLLRSFLAIIDSGSVMKAAQRLNCAQSTMSLRLQTLEERLGCALLERTSHPLTLTDKGSLIAAQARRVLAEHDKLIALALSPPLKTVRFGIAEDYAGIQLATALETARSDHPDVKFDITCALSNDLVAMIEKGKLDLAIVTPSTPQKHSEILSQPPLLWVCSPAFDPQREPELPLALYPEGCAFRKRALQSLDNAQIDWRIALTCPNGRGVLAMVEAGLAVTVMAEGTVPNNLIPVPDNVGLPRLGLTSIEIITPEQVPPWLPVLKQTLRRRYTESS